MLGIAILLMLSTSPQQVEAETGSHIARAKPADIPEGSMSPVDRARATAVEFGECIAGRKRVGAERAVRNFPSSREENAAMQRLADSECLRSGELRMPIPAMRGAIFVGMYRRDFLSAAPSLAPEGQIDFAAGAPQPTTAAAVQEIALRSFADCVARRDLADARMAVITPVASKAETAAYSKLSAHLGACLPQGTRIVFSKTILQGLFAEALYREAVPMSRAGAK